MRSRIEDGTANRCRWNDDGGRWSIDRPTVEPETERTGHGMEYFTVSTAHHLEKGKRRDQRGQRLLNDDVDESLNNCARLPPTGTGSSKIAWE